MPVHRWLDRGVSPSWLRSQRIGVLALAVLAACRRGDAQDAALEPPSTAREAPLVEFAGCSGAADQDSANPHCTLPSAPAVIHLWVSATTVPVVEIDGAPAAAHTRPTVADTGWTIGVDVPPTATAI